MKTKYIGAALLALGVTLASCSQPETEASPESASTTPETTSASGTPTATLSDLSDGVSGLVGFTHGLDCVEVDDCSLMFTVEELVQLDQCDDYYMEPQPAGTNLIKATVRLTTKEPAESDYRPGEFPIWTDWSALTTDGVNLPLDSSESCYNDKTQKWQQSMQVGDTEIRTHYMDVPEGATAIRMTETLGGARWEFDLATELNKNTEPENLPSPKEAAEQPAQQIPAPAQEEPVQLAPAPVEQPAAPVEQAPAEPPVRGFTGAPGSPIVELDKTISHCGDPMMYETGTTFFTDGSTGWTETCSAQMLG